MVFNGCAVVATSHKVHEDLATTLGNDPHPVLMPPQISLHELRAGGRMETRDDWGETAGANFKEALSEHFASRLHIASLPESSTYRDEHEEVHKLLQVFTQNQTNVFTVLPDQGTRPLSYQVGPLTHLPPDLQNKTLLYVFIYDSYSSAGRKALSALTMVAGAAVGVVMVPGTAPTLCSAIAVTPEGKVLWYNHCGSQGDLRTPEGAKALVKALFTGFPAIGS